MLKKILLLVVLITILSTTSLLYSTKNVFASNITPSTQTFNLEPEDLSFGEITYTNDTKLKETITVSVSTYDTKTEKTLTNTPFITLKQSKFTINPKTKVIINYIISIPKDTPIGTYSNVILIQKQESTKDSGNLSILPTIGSLFVFHISNSTTTIDKIFYDSSDIQIIVKKKGLPYIFDTEFEYVYVNNSQFVFRPEGEIRILDSNSNELMERFVINEDKKAIYPGQSITKTFNVKLWKDYKDIFKPKSIVSKTYNDIDGTFVLNKVEVNIINQIIVIGSVVTILIIAILYLIISAILRIKRSRKEKVSA